MFSLRNDPSLQTNVPAFPAHFLFHAGSWAPHCASQRQPGRVQGHWFCGTIQSFYATTARPLQWAAELFGLLHVFCIKLCQLGIFRFSHFHNGFCGHITADGNCLPPAWFLFNSPQGLLRGPLLPTGPNTFYTG